MIHVRIRSAPGGEDEVGEGNVGEGISEKDTPAGRCATTSHKNKGPRNGPDPRGAGKLNRFRERLDGDFAESQIRLEGTAGIRAAA